MQKDSVKACFDDIVYNSKYWKQLKCPSVEDSLNKLYIIVKIEYHALL